jgi:hypothetical protein
MFDFLNSLKLEWEKIHYGYDFSHFPINFTCLLKKLQTFSIDKTIKAYVKNLFHKKSISRKYNPEIFLNCRTIYFSLSKS